MSAPEDTDHNPMTLAFRDSGFEAAYWSDFWDEHIGYAKWALLIVIAAIIGWGPFEWILFPERFSQFWMVRYGILLPGLLAALPIILHPRFTPFMRRYVQEVAMVLTVWAFLWLGVLSVLLIDLQQERHVLYVGLLYAVAALYPYVVLRMRFLYAAALGWGLFAAATAVLFVAGDATSFSKVVLVAAGSLYNSAGMFGAFLIERLHRQAWLTSRALSVEQGKVERLLLNVLPSEIADRLKISEKPIADSFDAVTVLFADIAGFTPLSASMSPRELVDMLDTIFSAFDRIADEHGVEKIKTIGDAYMAAAGIPIPREDHAVVMCAMALQMQEWLAEHPQRGDLDVRIGVHSGPVVAGVIGRRKFIYDLWGDTVNTASRMESHGEPGRIQLTGATRALVGSTFELIPRGVIEVKGLGPVETWWLGARHT